jgi:hypothetical protein
MHVCSHQDIKRDHADLARPEQLNLLVEAIFVMPQGISPVVGSAHSEANSLSTSFESKYRTIE